MKPYYQDDFATIYHGDCLKSHLWLVGSALVTDPPFGRGWRQGRMKVTSDDSHDGIHGDGDTFARDAALGLWVNQKPVNDHRLVVMFGDLMLAPPWGTKQVLIYQKPPNAGCHGATGGHRRDLEAIYLIGPWPSGIGGSSSLIATTEPSQGNPSSPQGRWGHPHAKPEDVMRRLVGLTSGLVVDPFMGSGSTLVAAKALGRKCMGIELEERYCEIAAKRLSQEVLDFGGAA